MDLNISPLLNEFQGPAPQPEVNVCPFQRGASSSGGSGSVWLDTVKVTSLRQLSSSCLCGSELMASVKIWNQVTVGIQQLLYPTGLALGHSLFMLWEQRLIEVTTY